ncbi:DUF2155 domain-containing protein [Amaricoccus sp.]|uniref:DUF2155 domain-containing protein n=1 Tax=Amaricoccus sp. TaxID=1872485 RepID=UPI002602553A|nr:DUF2155 domain-containing protein [uncultured Amaricoccus sp.]
MTRLLILFATLCAGMQAVAAQSVQIANDQRTRQVNELHLRALDTLNGATTDLTVQVGETVRFGRLEITADTCRVPEDNPKGDAYAFLRIRDTREDHPRFSGWMFASSPALSALDHPRYDVWVVSCNNR